MNIVGTFLLLIIIGLIVFYLYLNRGLQEEIKPAHFTCLNLKEGHFAEFDTVPSNIYGIGLAYASHINETASEFDPKADPPIFKKALTSKVGDGARVKIPSKEAMFLALESLEAGITHQITAQKAALPALLDYETELGFVLMEDIDAADLEKENFAPQIGFFIANDLSARSVAIFGEGQDKRYEYWGISKSFPGFLPMSDQIWIPHEYKVNAIPCIIIETLVNGQVRQHQNTSDLIYTPLQMLQAIHRKYPNVPLKKGDLVLTGTPGGVAFSSPRWLVRLANMIGMNRFKKLASLTRKSNLSNYLQSGDKVIVRGEDLGSVEVVIEE